MQSTKLFYFINADMMRFFSFLPVLFMPDPHMQTLTDMRSQHDRQFNISRAASTGDEGEAC